MARIDVGIAQCVVSNDPHDSLVIVGLGSCVAVVAYDREALVGGLIHIQLPTSKLDPDRAQREPAMFADTGLPVMFADLHAFGCKRSSLTVKIAGGASMYDDGGHFDIGERNLLMVRRMLWKTGIFISGEDVGGTKARTVRLSVGSGECVLRKQREEYLL